MWRLTELPTGGSPDQRGGFIVRFFGAGATPESLHLMMVVTIVVTSRARCFIDMGERAHRVLLDRQNCVPESSSDNYINTVL